MNREKLLDKIEEIQLENYNAFVGTNESELHTREDIANFVMSELRSVIIGYHKKLEEVVGLEGEIELWNVDEYIESL